MNCMFVQWSPLTTVVSMQSHFLFLAAVPTATALAIDPTREACTQSCSAWHHWTHFTLVPLGPRVAWEVCKDRHVYTHIDIMHDVCLSQYGCSPNMTYQSKYHDVTYAILNCTDKVSRHASLFQCTPSRMMGSGNVLLLCMCLIKLPYKPIGETRPV